VGLLYLFYASIICYCLVNTWLSSFDVQDLHSVLLYNNYNSCTVKITLFPNRSDSTCHCSTKFTLLVCHGSQIRREEWELHSSSTSSFLLGVCRSPASAQERGDGLGFHIQRKKDRAQRIVHSWAKDRENASVDTFRPGSTEI
jgi:hypothetical protein